jgi:hypothetical protein
MILEGKGMLLDKKVINGKKGPFEMLVIVDRNDYSRVEIGPGENVDTSKLSLGKDYTFKILMEQSGYNKYLKVLEVL